jgi:hypothetical protein
MRLRVLLLFWALLTSIASVNPSRVVFGVRVSYQATGEMLSFVAYLDNGISQSYKKILTEREFMNIVTGKWPSIYNPKRENLFEINKVDCIVMDDPVSNKATFDCASLDSLWKLRFERFPFKTFDEGGWSAKPYKPTEKQELYLYNTYNIRSIDMDYFADSNFWKIMRDVKDPEWIQNYKSLR